MILPVRTIARTMTTATLALTLVACGGGSSSTPETSPGDDIIDDDPDETTEPPASPPRIELQGTINHVTDQSGEAHLYGTVKNTGGTAATFIKAVCLFYRADSSLIRDMDGYIQGTNLAFTDINITTNTALKPGDTGVFAVSSICRVTPARRGSKVIRSVLTSVSTHTMMQTTQRILMRNWSCWEQSTYTRIPRVPSSIVGKSRTPVRKT